MYKYRATSYEKQKLKKAYRQNISKIVTIKIKE